MQQRKEERLRLQEEKRKLAEQKAIEKEEKKKIAEEKAREREEKKKLAEEEKQKKLAEKAQKQTTPRERKAKSKPSAPSTPVKKEATLLHFFSSPSKSEVTKAPEQKQKEEETLQLQDVFTEALRSQTLSEPLCLRSYSFQPYYSRPENNNNDHELSSFLFRRAELRQKRYPNIDLSKKPLHVRALPFKLIHFNLGEQSAAFFGTWGTQAALSPCDPFAEVPGLNYEESEDWEAMAADGEEDIEHSSQDGEEEDEELNEYALSEEEGVVPDDYFSADEGMSDNSDSDGDEDRDPLLSPSSSSTSKRATLNKQALIEKAQQARKKQLQGINSNQGIIPKYFLVDSLTWNGIWDGGDRSEEKMALPEDRAPTMTEDVIIISDTSDHPTLSGEISSQSGKVPLAGKKKRIRKEQAALRDCNLYIDYIICPLVKDLPVVTRPVKKQKKKSTTRSFPEELVVEFIQAIHGYPNRKARVQDFIASHPQITSGATTKKARELFEQTSRDGKKAAWYCRDQYLKQYGLDNLLSQPKQQEVQQTIVQQLQASTK